MKRLPLPINTIHRPLPCRQPRMKSFEPLEIKVFFNENWVKSSFNSQLQQEAEEQSAQSITHLNLEPEDRMGIHSLPCMCASCFHRENRGDFHAWPRCGVCDFGLFTLSHHVSENQDTKLSSLHITQSRQIGYNTTVGLRKFKDPLMIRIYDHWYSTDSFFSSNSTMSSSFWINNQVF